MYNFHIPESMFIATSSDEEPPYGQWLTYYNF